MVDDTPYHLLALNGGDPKYTVGRATSLTSTAVAAPPQRPFIMPGTPPQRPQREIKDRKAVQAGELMAVPFAAAALFEGDAPRIGDVVELVCVRADNHGWGLGLRVKKSVAPTEESE